MRLVTSLTVFFALLMCQSVTAQEYETDVQLWTGVKLKKDLPKRFSVAVQYEVRLQNYMAAFKGSYFYAGVEYEIIKKYLSAEFEYRYVTSFQKDKHRFCWDLTGKYKFGKFSFSDRLAYQREHEYFNNSYENGHEPTNYIRNRLQIKYDFKKHWEAYVSTEPYIQLSNKYRGVDRIRSIAGIDWEFKKGHTLDLFYVFQIDIHQKNPDISHSIGLMYEWDLPKFKKKRKA